MDRQVGPAVEHRGLDFLDENPLAAHLPYRDVLAAVAGGLDDDQLDGQAGMGALEPFRDPPGLPQGQGAAAGGDSDPRQTRR